MAAKIWNYKIGQGHPLALMSGPCVIESEKITLETAEKLAGIAEKLGMPFIFKSSYDKANRSDVKYYRGPGIKKGLKILSKVRKLFNVPVISDIQCRNEIAEAADVLDALQVPAYLCQQTDLVVAAAETGKPVNIKKGQFIAPWDMPKICRKAESTGNKNILVTERGTVFGYNNLVCDMRSIHIIRAAGYPVIADITHIVRLPGPPSKDASGGQPELIPTLINAAVGAGADGLFLEVHPCPEKALCDAASMLRLDKLESILLRALEISRIVRQ